MLLILIQMEYYIYVTRESFAYINYMINTLFENGVWGYILWFWKKNIIFNWEVDAFGFYLLGEHLIFDTVNIVAKVVIKV